MSTGFYFTSWNPVKELKAYRAHLFFPGAYGFVESGEGIESI